ncbi:MAG: cytochrome c3 family protein [Myxococcaceae bacterium]
MKLPPLTQNWLSAAGAVIAAVSTFVFLLLFGLTTLGHLASPYLGIFTYLLLPPVILLGLLLIPYGMLRRARQIRRGEKVEGLRWPRLDFNDPRQRNAALVFAGGTVAFVLLSVLGTYQAYHFSESVRFCGTTCHVMTPEYTAYQASPHAKVACVECHVGPGAGYYAKAKLTGLHQVYSVITDTYARPISAPVSALRPAQQTCENCHWPQAFFGGQQKRFVHYRYDESNSEWPINLLIKTGGGDPRTAQVAGIHWHMNVSVRVEYIARDAERQDIPWIRVTDLTSGRSTVYQDKNAPLSPGEVAAATPRAMDCMDCHDRPSHVFSSPDRAVDLGILTGRIDRSLPGIKQLAVSELVKEYPTRDQALAGIALSMTEHFKTQTPLIYQGRRQAVDDSIVGTQQAFARNLFPEMKARWSAYPNNIGHLENLGCFRCHLGNHVREDAVPVSHACEACHLILSQGGGARAQAASSVERGLEFEHPEDIGDLWKETACSDCHSGVNPAEGGAPSAGGP